MAAVQMSSLSGSAFQPNVVKNWNGRSARTVITHPDQLWRPTVSGRLEELMRLPVGWDGYRGRPLSLETAVFTLRMMDVLCANDMAAPQVVPGSQGDLQVEWHLLDASIELHVLGPNRVHAWRCTPELPDGEEIDLTNDFNVVVQWIKDMFKVHVGPLAAAG